MGGGGLIISLDFELHWGVRDSVTVAEKKDHFLRARDAIPETLRILREHEVHATWATVGFLFARNKRQLLRHLPEIRPSYTQKQLDPYAFLSEIGEDERRDPFHYAPSLLDAIAAVPGQEIASHTFSHYYCLENGQTQEAFEADLRAAAAIGERFGNVIKALVFPRGQHNTAYNSVLERLGVQAYRTQPSFFPYRPRSADRENLGHRGLRLLDSYLPLGGFHTDLPRADPGGPVPLRSGLFLRPFSSSRRSLESLRMRRTRRAMQEAARKGHDFHLWWHPHNFGTHTDRNLAALRETLDEYRTLRERHGWPSRTMGEAAAEARGRA